MSVTIYVADLPEFAPLVEAVRKSEAAAVVPPKAGYWQLQAPRRITFSRKALKLRPALWFSMLSGGYRGRLTEFTRDAVTIESGE
ncbi:MAG TPA: hypothetical protein VLK85_29475 [Ramlibacter sp.]|nr:hypothetical protein [Ramlibacter sp.]